MNKIYLFIPIVMLGSLQRRLIRLLPGVLSPNHRLTRRSKFYPPPDVQRPFFTLIKNHFNNALTFSKSTALLIVFLFIYSGAEAQSIYLTGTDICTDGTQSTEIGITDAKPNAYYALFRNEERISLRQQNSGITPNPINFGEFSQPGIYTVTEYENYKNDLRNTGDGIQISGQIAIKSMPVLFIKDKSISINSGETFHYEPRADMKDAQFIWTASIAEGKVEKFDDRGKGEISVLIKITNEKPAKVIFSIIPVAPDHLGGCMGNAREIFVNINP